MYIPVLHVYTTWIKIIVMRQRKINAFSFSLLLLFFVQVYKLPVEVWLITLLRLNITMQMYMVYLRQLSWMVWESRGQIFWSPIWVTKFLGGYEKEALKIYFNSYFVWFLGLLYFVKQNKIKSVLRKIKTCNLCDENLFFTVVFKWLFPLFPSGSNRSYCSFTVEWKNSSKLVTCCCHADLYQST